MNYTKFTILASILASFHADILSAATGRTRKRAVPFVLHPPACENQFDRGRVEVPYFPPHLPVMPIPTAKEFLRLTGARWEISESYNLRAHILINAVSKTSKLNDFAEKALKFGVKVVYSPHITSRNEAFIQKDAGFVPELATINLGKNDIIQGFPTPRAVSALIKSEIAWQRLLGIDSPYSVDFKAKRGGHLGFKELLSKTFSTDELASFATELFEAKQLAPEVLILIANHRRHIEGALLSIDKLRETLKKNSSVLQVFEIQTKIYQSSYAPTPPQFGVTIESENLEADIFLVAPHEKKILQSFYNNTKGQTPAETPRAVSDLIDRKLARTEAFYRNYNQGLIELERAIGKKSKRPLVNSTELADFNVFVNDMLEPGTK